jgi:trehalose/maltose transport system substrate-binding protein
LTFASLFVLGLNGCRNRASNEPITITFLDPEWSHDLTERNVLPDARLQNFTRQTGINVKHLPTPEPTIDQLAMARTLLKQGASSPDVLGVDVVWTGTLRQDLIDLKPYFSAELPSLDPDVVASFTAAGKLVAVPFHSDIGVLLYRKDLIRAYGYKAPPSTWDELERMAAKIQQGERAKGPKDFWGFVWPGAEGEGLTCNALEWQMSDGGGAVIEADRTISVNNPHAIRSWQRAAHWIGSITNPNALSYQEWDAVNAFYSGKAAFYRGWARSYFLGVEAEANPVLRDTAKIESSKIGITGVPAGNAGQVSVLGGFGLGISRSSAHLAQALEFVRFLLEAEITFERTLAASQQPQSYEQPTILQAPTRIPHSGQRSQLVDRPSNVLGVRYDDVDRAYIRTLHSVLTRRTGAPEAAAKLEKELVELTGFKTGPPTRLRNSRDGNARTAP